MNFHAPMESLVGVQPSMDDAQVSSNGAYDQFLADEIARIEEEGDHVSKIVLIAALRMATGLDLKEAKDAVEEFGHRKSPRSPWLYGL
jgi:ribosomal protein L7/L12